MGLVAVGAVLFALVKSSKKARAAIFMHELALSKTAAIYSTHKEI